MDDAQAPEILFRLRDGEVIAIPVPELLEFTVVETALSQFKIVDEPTIFIFPGVIVKTAQQAFFVSARALPTLEVAGPTGAALEFNLGAQHYSVSRGELDLYTGVEQIRAREPLTLDGDATPFNGSLLRDTNGGLYYLPIGAFETLTSIGAAISAAVS